jgi:hypothetical protein
VRVPDEVLKCVAFLAYEGPNGGRLAGTAFLLSIAIPDTDRMAVYVVTAKHVIDGIREHATTPYVYIRMNTHEGGSRAVQTPIAAWLSHPDDPFVDVAMIAWVPSNDIFDYQVLAESMIATDEVIQARGIGVGDEAFLTGLFSNHFGTHRNIPIVRVGNIAAMPDEPVRTDFAGTQVAIDAYLLETRSIGGLSGSPVFVVTTGMRGGTPRMGGPQFYLLGLMHGHWDVRFSLADAVIPNGVQAEAVNMGIAIVVPASKILEVTNRPEFVLQRLDAANQFRRDQQPDSNDLPPADPTLP